MKKVILIFIILLNAHMVLAFDLVLEQQRILDNTQEYIDCLDNTKAIKGDFDTFNKSVQDCIDKANESLYSIEEEE